MAGDRSETGVKSVQVALDVIETVATAGKDIGVSEVAAKLGLTKATVFRHLQTLVERNYLEQSSKTARYRLGIQCHLLGQISSARADLLSVSEETASRLRDETGVSVVISSIRMRSVVVLATHLSPAALQIGEKPGSELSLYGSAQGRVAVAFSRKPLLAQLKRQKLEAFTPNTITEMDRLEALLVRVRALGWADAPEEVMVGINTLAAPLFDGSGDAVGTLALVGSVQDLPPEPKPGHVEALLAAAAQISVKLGYNLPFLARNNI